MRRRNRPRNDIMASNATSPTTPNNTHSESFMRALTVLAIAVAAALPAAALAQQQKSPTVAGAVATEPGKGKAVAVVEASATVTAVDKATREVTLKMPSGHLEKVQAGEEVRNFDQIKVGDTLKIKYIESLALELKKGGKEVVGRKETGALDRSQPGQKPGGVVRREVTVVANVVAVDEAKMKVSVKNDKGEVYDFNLKDPAQVKLVKVGDQVQATYTEGLAVSMEPAHEAPKAHDAKPAAPAKKK